MSFVCSVGNIPLASLLWANGISFGGVISFIYADLLVIPLILIYRKYFGGRATVHIVVIFYVSMVASGNSSLRRAAGADVELSTVSEGRLSAQRIGLV